MDDDSVKVSGGILLLRSKSGTSKAQKVLVYTKRGKKKNQVKWLHKYGREKKASKIPVWVKTYKRSMKSMKKRKSLQSVKSDSKEDLFSHLCFQAGDLKRNQKCRVCTLPSKNVATLEAVSALDNYEDVKLKSAEEPDVIKENIEDDKICLNEGSNLISVLSARNSEILPCEKRESRSEETEDDEDSGAQSLSLSDDGPKYQPLYSWQNIPKDFVDKYSSIEFPAEYSGPAFINENILKSAQSRSTNIIFLKREKSQHSYIDYEEESFKIFDKPEETDHSSEDSTKNTNLFMFSQPTIVMTQYQSTKRENYSESSSEEYHSQFIESGLRPLSSGESRLEIDQVGYQRKKKAPEALSIDVVPLLSDISSDIMKKQKKPKKKKKDKKTTESSDSPAPPADTEVRKSIRRRKTPLDEKKKPPSEKISPPDDEKAKRKPDEEEKPPGEEVKPSPDDKPSKKTRRKSVVPPDQKEKPPSEEVKSPPTPVPEASDDKLRRKKPAAGSEEGKQLSREEIKSSPVPSPVPDKPSKGKKKRPIVPSDQKKEPPTPTPDHRPSRMSRMVLPDEIKQPSSEKIKLSPVPSPVPPDRKPSKEARKRTNEKKKPPSEEIEPSPVPSPVPPDRGSSKDQKPGKEAKKRTDEKKKLPSEEIEPSPVPSPVPSDHKPRKKKSIVSPDGVKRLPSQDIKSIPDLKPSKETTKKSKESLSEKIKSLTVPSPVPSDHKERKKKLIAPDVKELPSEEITSPLVPTPILDPTPVPSDFEPSKKPRRKKIIHPAKQVSEEIKFPSPVVPDHELKDKLKPVFPSLSEAGVPGLVPTPTPSKTKKPKGERKSTSSEQSKTSPSEPTDTSDSGPIKKLKDYEGTTFTFETGMGDIKTEIEEIQSKIEEGKKDDICVHTRDEPKSKYASFSSSTADDFCSHMNDIPESVLASYSSTFDKIKPNVKKLTLSPDFCMHLDHPPDNSPPTSHLSLSQDGQEPLFISENVAVVSAFSRRASLTGSTSYTPQSTSTSASSLLLPSNREKRRSRIIQKQESNSDSKETSSSDKSRWFPFWRKKENKKRWK